MAADPARRKATYQDVLAAPEHVVAEILAGDLYTHPRPAGPHTETASVLGMDLGGAFHRGRGGPGGWIILNEPELHLGPDVIVPDVAGAADEWKCGLGAPTSEQRSVVRDSSWPISARSG